MKKWLVVVVVLIMMLTGCGKSEQVPGELGKPVEEGMNVPADSDSEEESQGQSNTDPGTAKQEETRVYEISEEEFFLGRIENGQIISQTDLSRACITSINQDGSLKEKIDISEVVQEKRLTPYHIVADKEGNYYLEQRKTIIKIGDSGNNITVIECEGTVECIGVGRSGEVYCTYYAGDEMTYLGKVEGDKIIPCDVELPQLNVKFAVMTAGVKAELLLYNRVGGIFVFDGSTQIQACIAGDALPVSGEGVVGCGFMNDGRLCLAAQKEGLTFYYVPVERAMK